MDPKKHANENKSMVDSDADNGAIESGSGNQSHDTPIDHASTTSAQETSKSPASRNSAKKKEPTLIHVMGSKGGAGCSFITSSIALYLTTMGRSVLYVDTDPRGPSAECFLTSPSPSTTGIDAQLVQGLSIHYLDLSQADFTEAFDTLVERKDDKTFDFILVDAGAYPSHANYELWQRANLNLMVVSPEPTSMANNYRWIQTLIAQQNLKSQQRFTAQQNLKSQKDSVTGNGTAASSTRVQPLKTQITSDSIRFNFVINHARLKADLDLGYQIQSATWRKFNQRIEYLGYIDHDKTILDCTRKHKPLIFETPGSSSSKSLERITRRLLLLASGKKLSAHSWSSPKDSYHDLLEVDRSTTDDEIRRSYKRIKETFDLHSLCVFGIYSPEEILRLREEIDRAYEVLMDSSKRKPYELRFFPSLPSESLSPPPNPTLEQVAPPSIDSETSISGAILKQARQSQHLSIQEVSNTTKIRSRYLQAIEEEDFQDLPAMVYVKGFVFEFAKQLGINPHQASRSYIERFKKSKNTELF